MAPDSNMKEADLSKPHKVGTYLNPCCRTNNWTPTTIEPATR